MRELPILFSAPMVRAILEGRKTVTRRVVKPQPSEGFNYVHPTEFDAGVRCWTGFEPTPRILSGTWIERKAPYNAGDRLWVRETLRIIENLDHGRARAVYEADRTHAIIHGLEMLKPIADGRCVPNGCHREAARIWLEVIDVRVERLLDIDGKGAIAEGIVDMSTATHTAFGIPGLSIAQHPVRAFHLLWDGLAKPGARCADDPWVWVVEFKRIDREARAA